MPKVYQKFISHGWILYSCGHQTLKSQLLEMSKTFQKEHLVTGTQTYLHVCLYRPHIFFFLLTFNAFELMRVCDK